MAKVLYEGYRIGKNGGERWVGTIDRSPKAGQSIRSTEGDAIQRPHVRKTPTGGSALSSTTKK